MTENFQSRNQLQAEIEALRRRVAELESSQHPVVQVQDLYRSLFENASDSIFIVEPGTLRVLDANTNAARRLKYSRDELLSMDLYQIEFLDDRSRSTDFIWVSSFSGTNVYECYHRCKDGSIMPVEVSSRLVEIDNRQVLQNLVRDLTRRKYAERQEIELQIERQRVQLLSDFITQASHHFKTPLSIIGASSYLLGKLEDSGQRKHQVEVVNNEIKNISRLVDSLVTLSTLAQNPPLQFARVEAGTLVRQAVEARAALIREKQLTVQLDLSPEEVWIEAHQDYLSLAITQVLDNAISYNLPNGTIWIRTGLLEAGVACIEIEDNGIGISADDLAHIFETFYRVDKAGTTRGFGLGLPMAKIIVELHRGVLDATSEPERGSIFRIRLPAV